LQAKENAEAEQLRLKVEGEKARQRAADAAAKE